MLADRLDDTITQKAPGSFFDGSDDSITIIHWKSFGGSHPARNIAREGSSRHGDDPCSRRVRKPSQQCPEKADSDDGNRVPCCDLAAAKDVHCTAERLAGKRLPREASRQRHDRPRVGHIEFGVAPVGERCDALAERQLLDSLAEGIDDTPAFMPKRPRLAKEILLFS